MCCIHRHIDQPANIREVIDHTDSANDVLQVENELKQVFEAANKRVYFESDVIAAEERCPSSSRGASDCWGMVEFWSSPSQQLGGIWNYTLWYDGGMTSQVNVNSNRNPIQLYTLPLQHAVDSAIANADGKTQLVDNIMQYPFTDMTDARQKTIDEFNYAFDLYSFLAFAFFFGLCGITYHLAGHITKQREDGMLQLMDAMMPNSSWQCLAIRLFAVHLAFDIVYAPGWIAMGIIAGTVAFPDTNTGLLVLLYLLTGFSLTGYSILASSLFQRVQISAISSAIAAIVFALVAQFAEGPYADGASLTGVIATAVLFSPSAFVYFLIDTALFERDDKALEIASPTSGSIWSIAAIFFIGCLILQIVLYPILGALLERWLHGHSSRSRHVRSTDEMGGSAIRLKEFSKEYNIAVKKRDRICAVENLSLDVHAGSITVLLGSNGSGKSTTLKAIAGLESVSRGSIEVDGTGGIGICPQQNVLWDEMTIKEHITCFQRLKNPALSRAESIREIDRLILACDLELKKYARAKTLSGGQKRKLQLGIMLAGGSRVCCIDEASSGIDPLARRKVWDVLLQERGRRTMLLTTHFLDESEVLSDHIAILSKGTLRAEGSVATLKSSLGRGYKVVLPSSQANWRDEDIPSSALTIRHEGRNNVYEAADAASLAQFISLLTRHRIGQYRVHGPSIEDVFLELADEMRIETETADELKAPESRKNLNGSQALDGQQSRGQASKSVQLQAGKGCGPLQQTGILFMKRVTVLKHNYMPYFGALFVPLVLAGMVTRFLLPPFAFPHGLECANQPNTGYSGYGNYFSRDTLYVDRLFYGPSDAITQQDLRTILPVGGFNLPKNEPPVFWNMTTSISSLDDLNSALTTFTSGRSSTYYAVAGVFLADSAPTFVFESTDWSTPSTAISAQSVLNQVLLNTTLAVSSAQLAAAYIPPVFQQAIIAVFMVLGFSIYPGFFSLYPTAERLQNVRAMQYSNGILSSSLWAAYAMFDLIFILLVSVLATAIWYACIGSQLYGIGYLFVVLLLYGIAATTYSYVISLFVPSQLSAMAATSLIQTVIAILFFVGYFVTMLNPDPTTYRTQLDNIYYPMALICPGVSLFRALFISLNVYSLACEGSSRAAYAGSIQFFGAPIAYLVVQSLLLICFLIFWESGRSLEIFGIRMHRNTSEGTEDINITDAVPPLAEGAEDAIHTAHTNNGLRVHNISKSFGKNLAVDKVTFGVLPSEKFALLGPNGAGKSTIISLIRGELHPDRTKPHGSVFISSDSLMQTPVAAKNHLGVCPQFDAIDRMTLSETLHFYARARGVPDRQKNIDELVECLNLADHVHKLVGKLSGGTKRKLSLAIALIANPSVLLLDEPSSGMDAAAKRALWQTLRDACADRCLLITTHSMEEADALCDRAGIMAKRMLALDTIPRLREKNGSRLYIHLVHRDAPYPSEAAIERLWQWVHKSFQAAQAEQKTFGGQMRFSVPVDGADGEMMGRLYMMIEEAKADIGVKDYSIGPTTLDQVFMNVVSRHGIEEEHMGIGRQRQWWPWGR